MQLARGSVRRDHAAGRGNRLQFAAALKYEEDLFVRDAEYAEALEGFQQAEPQFFLVEANRARKIVGEETGFDDAIDARRGHDNFFWPVEKRDSLRSLSRPFRGRNSDVPDHAAASHPNFIARGQFFCSLFDCGLRFGLANRIEKLQSLICLEANTWLREIN